MTTMLPFICPGCKHYVPGMGQFPSAPGCKSFPDGKIPSDILSGTWDHNYSVAGEKPFEQQPGLEFMTEGYYTFKNLQES